MIEEIQAEKSDSSAPSGRLHPIVVPLSSRLDTLSENAKEWLEKTCERFADGEGYDQNIDAIRECLSAELITKPKHSRCIEVDGDVMGAVYSEGYFRHNDQRQATASK